MLVPGCLACDILAGLIDPPGGVIYADDYWQVEHGLNPIALRGWLILKPRRHVEHIADLTPAEVAGLGPLLSELTQALTRAVRPDKIYVMSMGEAVKHIHFYLVPRYPDMPANGLEVLHGMFIAHAWECSPAEAAGVAALVRAELQHQLSAREWLAPI